MNKRNAMIFALLMSTPCAFGASLLQPASFPTTSMDSTFIERRDNAAVGYKPFSGRSAYQPIIIESEEKYMTRRAESIRQNDLASMTNAQYCAKYPLDTTKCPQTPGLYESVVAIGDRPTAMNTSGVALLPSPTTSVTPTGNIVGTSTTGQPVIASPLIHNGPCTPPQRSNILSNAPKNRARMYF